MPAQTTVEAAKEVSKAVSNDIAVLRTRFDVETGKGRKKRLVPVEAELHVNPVSILFAAAAGLAGALFATVAWGGISVPNPLGPPVVVVPGIKDTGLGKDISKRYVNYRQRKDSEEASREILKRLSTTEGKCADLLVGWNKLVAQHSAETDPTAKASLLASIKTFEDAMRALGCADPGFLTG